MTKSTDEPADKRQALARYFCGRCGKRWSGERTTAPVGCPRCQNYGTVGVDLDSAAAREGTRRGTRGAKS